MLRDLPTADDPRVLVGFGTSDDAGVFRLTDDLALVQTVDFFTPIVDDPYDFGRIAATNALSDIYAMGGTPITALNIAAYPMELLGPEPLARILAGGSAVARAAGVALLGGHTVKDDEPKYGMAVTGTIHPARIVTNARARPGDALVLTKPLGTGILGSALKNDAIDAAQMAACVRWMTTLNAAAARAMLAAGAHAATDVTGYGLLGHGYEMARASGVRLRIGAAQVPVYGLAREMVGIGITPGGTRANAEEHAGFTTFAAGVPADLRTLLSDAQTSGGLLIAVGPDDLGALLAGLSGTDALAAVIGSVEPGNGIVVEA
ncbi:MAG: selenide, water dikinase SelD [Vulcanimicrobiaceae bacterium]